MKVNILTTNNIYSEALIHTLQQRKENEYNIFVEKKNNGKQNVFKQAILNLIGKVKYLRLSNFIFPDDSKNTAILECLLINQAESKFSQNMKAHLNQSIVRFNIVKNMNSPDTERLIRQINPDYTFVFGTRILKKNIIDCSGDVLNFHSSLLPEYRGVFPEFWQCYNQDFESVGYTIHLIDEGIDTGDILFQEKCDLKSHDPFKLRVFNVINMINSINDTLDKYEKGVLKKSKQRPENVKTYYYSAITDEKKYVVYSRAIKELNEKH